MSAVKLKHLNVTLVRILQENLMKHHQKALLYLEPKAVRRAIDTIFYLPRRSAHSATKNKESRQVKWVSKSVIVGDRDTWCPLFARVLLWELILIVVHVGVDMAFSHLCSSFHPSVSLIRHDINVVLLKLRSYFRYLWLLFVMKIALPWLTAVSSARLTVAATVQAYRYFWNFVNSFVQHSCQPPMRLFDTK